jgi:hypothetical protein
VITANISWNMANACTGTPPLTSADASVSPANPKPPISPACESPNASENPTVTQTSVTAPRLTRLIIIMFSTLRARTMPP